MQKKKKKSILLTSPASFILVHLHHRWHHPFFSLAIFPVSNWRPTPPSASFFVIFVLFHSYQEVCVGIKPVFALFPNRDYSLTRHHAGGLTSPWQMLWWWMGDVPPKGDAAQGPMLQTQAVGAVCGPICYTLHNFPKQRSLNPLKTHAILLCSLHSLQHLCFYIRGLRGDRKPFCGLCCSHMCPTLF